MNRIAILFFAVLFSNMNANAFDPRSQIVQYNIPGRTASKVYSLKINGQPVFVEYYKSVPDAYEPGGTVLQWKLENVSIAHFSFTGDADIELTVNGKFTKYSLSPKRYNVASTKNGQVVSFSINKPMFLNFNTNNILDEQIFIFADPMEESPNRGSSKIKSINSFAGVDSTGITTCTKSIQSAISSLSKGDTLFFPPGIYKTGHLDLKSDMTLYIAGGAVLQGTGKQSDYIFGSDGVVNSLLGIKNVSNVTIDGMGRVDLDGEYMRNRTDNESSGGTGVKVLAMNGTNSNITVKNVFLMDSPKITANIMGEFVSFYNVKILSSQALENADGLDPWQSKHVVIDKCFLYGRDDNVCIYGDDWGNNNYAVEDIVVRNCVMSSLESNNKIVLDERSGSAVSNILFENNNCLFGSHAVKISTDYASNVKNVWFRNIYIERMKPSNYPWQGIPFIFEVKNGVDNNGNGKSGPIWNIHVQNLGSETLTKTDKPSFGVDKGLDAASIIDSVTFDNFSFGGNIITNVNQKSYVKYEGEVSKIKNINFNTDSTIQIVNIVSNNLFVENGKSGTFSVTRKGSKSAAIKIDYLIKGTAINGMDYNSIPGSVTIAAGDTSANIVIATKNNQNITTKQVYLSLQSASDHRYMLGSDFLAMINITTNTTGSVIRNTSGYLNLSPNICPKAKVLKSTTNEINLSGFNLNDLNSKILMHKKLKSMPFCMLNTADFESGMYILSAISNNKQ